MSCAWKVLFLGLAFLTTSAHAEVIKILAEDSFPPYSSGQGKQVEGLSADIVRSAFRTQNLEVQFEAVPYSRCLAKVQAGSELGCFSTTYDPTMLNVLIFPEHPLVITSAIAIAYKDSPEGKVSSVSDLEGRKVAVTNGFSYGAEFDYHPKIEKQFVSSDSNVLKLVAGKRVSHGVVNFLTYYYLLGKQTESVRKSLKVLGPIGTGGIYLMFSKKHPQGEQNAQKFDAGMESLLRSGEYEGILKKWGEKFGLSLSDIRHMSAIHKDPLRVPSKKEK
ncbi:transporter substrate-binding domain-containing protein [Bdellovibrio bacteriovorus]|uniref:substrate-binding periplasmic protein n=1 Tax=Bdellovibrio bacteriovorus TaxID=959 RepID=UPI0021D239DC|nr:transporter substrate-binding domain-containing protein [Bdellovibrio bacteriovorus]UXR65132.1 transporter substrate-binding domain-containing protein [Bdellovibrio bacteriovorus]